MNKPLKPLPRFATAAEERRLWESHHNGDAMNWGKATKVVMRNLKPTTQTIAPRVAISGTRQGSQ